MLLFSVLITFACAHDPATQPETPQPETPAAETTTPSTPAAPVTTTQPTGALTLDNPTGAVTPSTADPKTNAELYAECKQRVEGREAANECTQDSDCTKAGCSSEVCVTTAMASDIMTACDVQPCFAALDACGCNAGVCSWTVKADDAAPAAAE